MKTYKLFVMLLVVGIVGFFAHGVLAETKWIATFAGDKDGDFPKGWKTWPMQRGKAEEVYRVQTDGGAHLNAMDDKDISVQIFREFNWELEKYPVVSWKWRANKLPAGADESNPATNDSACGVYIVFGKSSGVALKYVWSSSLPVGKVVTKSPGKMYIIPLDSGGGGGWRSHKIDVKKDFVKYFGKDPSKNPSGIGILTDGNATHTAAECDYGGFAISNE